MATVRPMSARRKRKSDELDLGRTIRRRVGGAPEEWGHDDVRAWAEEVVSDLQIVAPALPQQLADDYVRDKGARDVTEKLPRMSDASLTALGLTSATDRARFTGALGALHEPPDVASPVAVPTPRKTPASAAATSSAKKAPAAPAVASPIRKAAAPASAAAAQAPAGGPSRVGDLLLLVSLGALLGIVSVELVVDAAEPTLAQQFHRVMMNGPHPILVVPPLVALIVASLSLKWRRHGGGRAPLALLLLGAGGGCFSLVIDPAKTALIADDATAAPAALEAVWSGHLALIALVAAAVLVLLTEAEATAQGHAKQKA